VRCGIWNDHSKNLANSSYWILSTRKVCRRFERSKKEMFFTCVYRKKGLLAFLCTCPWRSRRKTLWLPSMPRPSHRRWIFLRDGYRGTVSYCDYLIICYHSNRLLDRLPMLIIQPLRKYLRVLSRRSRNSKD